MHESEQMASIDSQLRTVLAPFCDSGTELGIAAQAKTSVRITGKRRLVDFDVVVELPEGTSGFVVLEKGSRIPLNDWLCRPPFADLDFLAQSMEQFLSGRLRSAGPLVETGKVAQEDESGRIDYTPAASQDIDSALRTSLSPADNGTRLTFLHGQAGAGKSWALMRLALTQAQGYLARKHQCIFLYVDAQGIALNTLEQQVARQLDVYNGALTYREIVPLVRMGKLAIIVDGFDELIMPSGFQETLNQLYGYLRDFDGQGSVLASSRTSFFRIHNLDRIQIEDMPQLKVGTLEVSPWDKEQWDEYCKLRKRNDLAPRLEAIASSDSTGRELLGRPFVVSKVVDLLIKGVPVEGGGLFAAIEDAFIERERTEKLVDLRGTKALPILKRDQFEDLLRDIALEMWHMRQTSLDLTTLKFIAELYSDDWKLAREFRRIMIERIDANSFLELAPGWQTEKRVQFPHDVMFSRMLARGFLGAFNAVQSRNAIDLFRVSPISETVAEQMVDLVAHTSSSGVASLLAQISKISEELRAFDSTLWNVRVGLGVCAATSLRKGSTLGMANLSLSNLYFHLLNLSGANAPRLTFKKVLFECIDARGASWKDVAFTDCDPIPELRITRGQVFHDSLPSVQKLVFRNESGELISLYGPARVRAELFGEASISKRVLGEAGKEIAELFSRLVIHGGHWFSEYEQDVDDGSIRKIKKNHRWRQLLDLLDECGLLTRSMRPKSGRNAELFHIRNVDELAAGEDPMAPVEPRVKLFWARLERL